MNIFINERVKNLDKIRSLTKDTENNISEW